MMKTNGRESLLLSTLNQIPSSPKRRFGRAINLQNFLNFSYSSSHFCCQVPAVFDGKHLIVYALLAEDAHVPQWAEVIAVSPMGPLTLKVHLNESNSEESQMIHW